MSDDNDYMWERISNLEYLTEQLLDTIILLQAEIITLVRDSRIPEEDWIHRRDLEQYRIYEYINKKIGKLPVWCREDRALTTKLDECMNYTPEEEVGDWI